MSLKFCFLGVLSKLLVFSRACTYYTSQIVIAVFLVLSYIYGWFKNPLVYLHGKWFLDCHLLIWCWIVQISALEWNRHHKEILSGHGYGVGELQNHLCLWKYPSLAKMGEIKGHSSRVLGLSQVWLLMDLKLTSGVFVITPRIHESYFLWLSFCRVLMD